MRIRSPIPKEQLEYEKILKIDRRARDSDRATDLVKDPAVMSAYKKAEAVIERFQAQRAAARFQVNASSSFFIDFPKLWLNRRKSCVPAAPLQIQAFGHAGTA